MSNVSQVRDFLKECNLTDYYDRFIAEGFDQLQSLFDVTEADLIAMDVKRGHRRREIATAKGISPDQPIFISPGDQSGLNSISNNIHLKTPHTPLTVDSATLESPQEGSRTLEDDEPSDPQHVQGSKCTKRKYRRHPKRDKNAPVKPLSAYVMFAHKVREEYRGKNIPFTEMAKIVGNRWKKIPPEEKKIIESNASKAKEEYQLALSTYKTTDNWKQYQEYLKEFKEKHNSNFRVPSGAHKRQKLGISLDVDTTTSSEYSSNQSSIGYHADNGSGNLSSGSSNSNSIENDTNHSPRRKSTHHGCLTHNYYNPTPYSSDSSASNSFVAPPSSVSQTNSTILDSLSAKDSGAHNSHGEKNISFSEDSSFSPDNFSTLNSAPAGENSEADELPVNR
ncbi:4449_t:CDS:2 [Acaulospora colombiana]|uniref:4449_t:CDS:1 n=1 Tax=Acaulospora colombiana TaxID=27376 RepID=A0ACA9KDQ5_9GLOM|nr:4449_t:CDS:2 [Acaulospora colombiana]